MEISLNDIRAAHSRIAPFIHRTPVLTSRSLDALAGAELLFKCENFQKIGAFKIRGGMNAALSLSPEEAQRGLTTHSSGNHAQAIAFAARQLGVPAYIVMPRSSPRVKVEAVRGYGAEIYLCEPTQQAREEAVQELIARTGATFIHPFDNEQVIAGQATCALELIEDAGPLDAVVAPVGGGGLLSGTCLSTAALLPEAALYAGEPEGAADAVLSFRSGRVEKAPYIQTIADGLLTTLSERTLAIIRSHVKDILLVSETEIREALRLVYERLKIVVEPSCVLPLAAVLRNRERFAGQRVGLILTGGNVDLARFGEWFGGNP
jgi:threonine dehydratase